MENNVLYTWVSGQETYCLVYIKHSDKKETSQEFFTGRQPRYIADIYLVVPALAWFVKTTYLREESKSELNVMLKIG